MTAALWWIRRDFRLHDNPTLDAALAHADQVIPVFVLDPFFQRSPYNSEKRYAFMLAGLRVLADDLRAAGSRLIVRQGDPADALASLVEETGAEAIYAQEDFSLYARQRDERIAARLPLTLTGGLTARPPEAVRKNDGDPYVVFTPYSQTWRALIPPHGLGLIPAPAAIPTPGGLASMPVPAEPAQSEGVPFPPGEAEALRRLAAFTAGDDPPINHYGADRDRVDVDGTSRLSPYIRWGMLSPRRAVAAAYAAIQAAPGEAAAENAERWLIELIWREFFISILYHYPHVLEGNFRREYDAMEWRGDDAGFAAWCAGRTGYPVVDAAMRQLATTGWMHNRARMIAASFLVKDLLIDWRRGERWFMQHLVDGDPAANNGGWQWTAGTGTDAAPYFRIFNPTRQSEKHDPEGRYIRRWVPELSAVPGKYIHMPAAMPESVQSEAGCIVGEDYPAPIVDHAAARERTKATYKAARQNGR